jgi:hypothetical protein
MASPAPDSIKSIQAYYRDVNRNPRRFRKVVRDFNVSTEGGQVVFWLLADRLVKAEASSFGESGDQHDEFYFRRGKLIFALSESVGHAAVFDADGEFTTSYDESTPSTRDVERIYFEQGHLIRWIHNGTLVSNALSKDDENRLAEIVKEGEVFNRRATKNRSFNEEDFR